MSHKGEGWGWMLAVDFFFAGMGGAMLLIGGITDLFNGAGRISVLGNFLGAVFMGIGSGFLILELGRPLQAWRVFMNPKAILTIGAWVMSIAIVAGLAFTSFGFAVFPWSGWTFIRKLLAVVCAISGLVVAAYPGILLGRHKARPFWNGPGMTSLFLLSSIVTGLAAHILSGFVVPAEASSDVLRWFSALTAGLLGLQLLLWFSYIWVKYSGATKSEAKSAQRWIRGDISSPFQVGFLLAGSLIPLLLILMSGEALQGIGALLALSGGFIMRTLVVKAGEERTWLPGECKYRSRLPLGDEKFLKAWSSK